MSRDRSFPRMSVKTLTLASMLCAMSVVIGMFCKNFLDFGSGLFRITFENLPIIISGVFLGPLFGGAVGASSDLISYLFSTKAYPPNLIVTLGAAAVGIVSGLVSKFVVRKSGYPKIIISGALAHVVGSMIIKTIGLFQYYSWGVLFRIPMYLVIAPLEIFLICMLYKNSAFRKILERMSTKPQKTGCKTKMTYENALEYIHSVSWKGSRPGLERTEELLRKMGDPQNKLKFVHVAGTNGKGSFCAMLSSILKESGYKVGTYTSPYVLRFNERMKINGEDIPDVTLARITEYVRPFAESMEDVPTEFELITAIAFEYFAREGCDIVVLECGMGGRLDSTNVINSPLLSVITGISLDHTAFLGSTIAEIAGEKAGIIKEGCPSLFCSDDSEALQVIRKKAESCDSPLHLVDRTSFLLKEMSLDGTVFDYLEYKNVIIPLLGSYQPHNACNVLSAVNILRDGGLDIPTDAICSGLSRVVWHARFEKLCDSPLIISDGGHNPEGIDAATDSIRLYFPDRRVIILTGVMADKDYRYMAEKMASVAEFVYTVRPDNPRSLSAEEYAEVFESLGVSSLPCENVGTALALAKERSGDTTPIICLGSLYMYEQVHRAIK